MRVRVLYYRRNRPEYRIGRVYEMPNPVALEYLDNGHGEPVRGGPVETATEPIVAEQAVEMEEEWPLKTKSPEDYIAEYGDRPEGDLSSSVATNLELARRIVEG